MSDVDIIFKPSQIKKIGKWVSLEWQGKVIEVPVEKCKVFWEQNLIAVPEYLLIEGERRNLIRKLF